MSPAGSKTLSAQKLYLPPHRTIEELNLGRLSLLLCVLPGLDHG